MPMVQNLLEIKLMNLYKARKLREIELDYY